MNLLKCVLGRRIGETPEIVGVIVVTIVLTRALPRVPAARFAGPAGGKEAAEAVREKLNLNESFIRQFRICARSATDPTANRCGLALSAK